MQNRRWWSPGRSHPRFFLCSLGTFALWDTSPGKSACVIPALSPLLPNLGGKEAKAPRRRCSGVIAAISQEGGNPSPTLQANSSPLNHGLSLPSCAWQMSQPHPGPYFYKASKGVCVRSEQPRRAQTHHKTVPSQPACPHKLLLPTSWRARGSWASCWQALPHGTHCRGAQ